MKISILALLIVSVLSISSVHADPQDCGLRTAMSERRAEVRDRNREMTRVGIQERNTSVVEASPTFSQGACMDQIYAVMDNITGSMKSSFGSVFTSQLTSQLGRMGCQEANRFYREIMNTELARFDDQLGIIRSGGQITGYSGNRTTPIDVRRAIELGRQAGSATQGVPMRPPGRGGMSQGEERAVTEGVRDAIRGL